MKFSLFSSGPKWPTITLVAMMLGMGMTQLLARPEPPAADRLMDPSKPENKGAEHLFFHRDDGTFAPAPPTASQQAFKDFKNGPATFEEFCKQNPLTGKPLGQERLTIEVLATAVDAATTPSPAEPTAAMLSEGTLLRQRVFGNSQAQTENVLPIDRQSDGSKMPEAAWEGERLFTCLEQTEAGYMLTFTYAESRVETWLKFPYSTIAQPVIIQRELNKKLSISPDGKWVAFEGLLSARAASDGGPERKVREVLYVRLMKN